VVCLHIGDLIVRRREPASSYVHANLHSPKLVLRVLGTADMSDERNASALREKCLA
jgi:hypothetical protein